MKTAIFAAGCFWGVQYYMNAAPGVIKTTVGFIGGFKNDPTYEEVKAHTTGHYEAIKVDYDETKTSFIDLCKLFFEIHDPAQTDGQGPDIGPQYRSAIFYLNNQQKKEALEVIKILTSKGHKVNTSLKPAAGDEFSENVFTKFWIAEDYHQDYYEKNGNKPYCHFRTPKF